MSIRKRKLECLLHEVNYLESLQAIDTTNMNEIQRDKIEEEKHYTQEEIVTIKREYHFY